MDINYFKNNWRKFLGYVINKFFPWLSFSLYIKSIFLSLTYSIWYGKLKKEGKFTVYFNALHQIA